MIIISSFFDYIFDVFFYEEKMERWTFSSIFRAEIIVLLKQTFGKIEELFSVPKNMILIIFFKNRRILFRLFYILKRDFVTSITCRNLNGFKEQIPWKVTKSARLSWNMSKISKVVPKLRYFQGSMKLLYFWEQLQLN